MRGSPTAQISVAIVCLILGALLMLQYQAHGSIAKAQMAESSGEQTTIISNLYESNLALRKEAETLIVQADEASRELEPDSLDALQSDLVRLRIFNGIEPVTGPGIELVVSGDLQAEHVLDLVNELKNAGAEAVAINGIRLGVDSAVATVRGATVIDGYALGDSISFLARSEERRVGKECRSRWSPYH